MSLEGLPACAATFPTQAPAPPRPERRAPSPLLGPGAAVGPSPGAPARRGAAGRGLGAEPAERVPPAAPGMAAPWRWGVPVTSQWRPARAPGWARRGGGGGGGGGSSSPPSPAPAPAHGPRPQRSAASGGGVAGARSPPPALARERPRLCPRCTWAMEEKLPAAAAAAPALGIAVDENNVRPGALRLIRELRPQWEPERVKTKLFTDGITNKLMACYMDEGMADAVLVRVYGRKTELFVDRENELKNFQVLRAHGCAPNLYCTFQNGLCYEFMQGMALGPEHVRQPQIFRLIAWEMAKMHAIHANGSLPKPSLWHKLHKYLTIMKTDLITKASNPRFRQEVPSLEVLEEEVAWLKEYLSQLGSPIVLCHNDLLCKNIIYNATEGHVRFIDYEYAGYNYQAFDIGNHFNEFAGVNEVDYSLYPSRDTQLQWLRHYLQAYKQLSLENQGSEGGVISDQELETLYVQANQFALASHFLWACWALIQDKYSTIDFNFFSRRE
ncbi:ethanolamine kinase 2 isoform X2 [Dermochelys coriacea]|uniref:ethanolamine kinase 2 isoform X2 n=1 Tax=Dermochelys coriacea TaxID=27794 RepID=UPI0018E82F17|nr:ethanolamine kinase 2 isoform X2 [Dermochelys coriacea]